MYAIFEDGSRQYRVEEGSTVTIDFREASIGDASALPPRRRLVVLDLQRDAGVPRRVEFAQQACPGKDPQRSRFIAGGDGCRQWPVVDDAGGQAIGIDAAKAAVARLKRSTNLPIAVGFGVRDAASAGAMRREWRACSS